MVSHAYRRLSFPRFQPRIAVQSTGRAAPQSDLASARLSSWPGCIVDPKALFYIYIFAQYLFWIYKRRLLVLVLHEGGDGDKLASRLLNSSFTQYSNEGTRAFAPCMRCYNSHEAVDILYAAAGMQQRWKGAVRASTNQRTRSRGGRPGERREVERPIERLAHAARCSEGPRWLRLNDGTALVSYKARKAAHVDARKLPSATERAACIASHAWRSRKIFL